MVRDLPKAAGGILSYFTRHGTAANLLLVVLIIAGLVSLPRMRAQFFPDVIIDNVTVSVAWRGAGAEDVDDAIVQLLEPALLSVEGVTGAKSTSREERANILLEFEPGWIWRARLPILKQLWIRSRHCPMTPKIHWCGAGRGATG